MVGAALVVATAAHADRGEALLRQALRHYAQGRFEAAIRVLHHALTATTAPKTLGQVQLFLGVSYAVTDRPAEAREAFAAALRYDPQVTLDPERFKPALVRLFLAVKQRVLGGPSSAPVSPPPRAGGASPPAVASPAAAAPPRAAPVAPPSPSGPSRAQVVLRPGTRRGFFLLAAGPGIGLTTNVPSNLKLSEVLGFHFFRRSSGPGLALGLGQGLGGDWLLLEAGVRFFWDIQLGGRYAVHLTPFVQPGYILAHFTGYPYDIAAPVEPTAHAFNVAFGLAVQLLLVDRAILHLQLVGIDLGVNANGADVRYDLLLGGGVTF